MDRFRKFFQFDPKSSCWSTFLRQNSKVDKSKTGDVVDKKSNHDKSNPDIIDDDKHAAKSSNHVGFTYFGVRDSEQQLSKDLSTSTNGPITTTNQTLVTTKDFITTKRLSSQQKPSLVLTTNHLSLSTNNVESRTTTKSRRDKFLNSNGTICYADGTKVDDDGENLLISGRSPDKPTNCVIS